MMEPLRIQAKAPALSTLGHRTKGQFQGNIAANRIKKGDGIRCDARPKPCSIFVGCDGEVVGDRHFFRIFPGAVHGVSC